MNVYLDHAATTCMRKEVLIEMFPYMSEIYGNPASAHSFGSRTHQALERSRATIADALKALPEEIFFTSGGTESNNWAIRGAANNGLKIITTQIEHPSVLNVCKDMQAGGFEVVYLPVDEYGIVSINALKNALDFNTSIVSVMAANNEIGTIEPIADVGRVVKTYSRAYFHVDAVQAAGALNADDFKLPFVDMISISAHKFYGPEGIGALYIRKGTRVNPLMRGGSQERGMRAGTANVAGAVGMARALELATAEQPYESRRLIALRQRLVERVLSGVKGARLNGHFERRLPNNANFSFTHIDGEMLAKRLNAAGFAVSTGSACAAKSHNPSHVLAAIGLSRDIEYGACRATLGKSTTAKDIDAFLNALVEITADLRK